MNAKNPPVLRYYGSKARLAGSICHYLHHVNHKVFVDGCGGAGNVILTYIQTGYRSPIMVYNDIDDDVVNFFEMLRNRSDDLLRAINLTPYARVELNRAFLPPIKDDPIDKARKFYIRSWQAFASKPGQTSAAWRADYNFRRGRLVLHDWLDNNRLESTVEKLKLVMIEHLTFEKIIEKYDSKEALLYFDPPYLPEVRNRREHDAYVHEFTQEQHETLASLLGNIKGIAAVSHKPSEMYDEFYKGWHKFSMQQQNTSHSSHPEVLYVSPGAQVQNQLL